MFRPAHLRTVLLAIVSLFLVLSIIGFPKQAYESSLRGLTIWWDVVFPSLLPFFITAELLIGFGVVHFLGVLFEPFMKPLFRIPGVGGFVMSMSVSSGYPMGAKLTVRLREQNMISRAEGERLLATSSTSGPLFMFGAVAVGFFHDVKLGIIIAAAHYLGAFFVGLIMRFHHFNEAPKDTVRGPKAQRNLFYRALQAMHRARIQDGRPIGSLMGDAIAGSIQTLLSVGGFIIIFSVLINIMKLIQIDVLFSFAASLLLSPLGFPAELSSAIFAGLFEITLGSQLASISPSSIPLLYKVAISCAVISWSGLSVHAQVASMIARTDISYRPYLFARVLHAILAGTWVFILWKPYQYFINQTSIPTFFSKWTESPYWAPQHFFLASLMLGCLFIIISYFLVQWAKARKKLF